MWHHYGMTGFLQRCQWYLYKCYSYRKPAGFLKWSRCTKHTWAPSVFWLSILCAQELDLNNPKTFRNLSKPMGAQTDDRLIQYKKRFKDWEDPNGGFRQERHPLTGVIYLLCSVLKRSDWWFLCVFLGETPAYHYGTHYSSAMIVASYLVRMEPFTQIFLRLQVSAEHLSNFFKKILSSFIIWTHILPWSCSNQQIIELCDFFFF